MWRFRRQLPTRYVEVKKCIFAIISFFAIALKGDVWLAQKFVAIAARFAMPVYLLIDLFYKYIYKCKSYMKSTTHVVMNEKEKVWKNI